MCRRIYQLSPPREHPVSSIFIGDMHLLLILQVSNKKFAHIVDGNIPTQPRRFVFPLVTLISGVSRPPARPLSLWLPQLAGWTPPALCASAPLAAVDSPTAFGRCLTSRTAAQCFQASENQVGDGWAVSRTYPFQLNGTDSRPRARWYQLLGLPLLGSQSVCPKCNTSFVITRGSAKPSSFDVPSIS